MFFLALNRRNNSQRVQRFTLLLLPSVLLALAFIPQDVHNTTLEMDRRAKTLYYHNRPPNAKGDFHYEFQTSNGITTKAAGNLHGTSGVFQYVSREGIPITMTYVADANGYHPSGEHILVDKSQQVQRIVQFAKTHQAPDEKKTRFKRKLL